MDKSYVTLEQHKCIVCTKDYDTNALLLDRRLRPTFERYTVTGWGLCPECSKKESEGFIALVEVDPTKCEMRVNAKPDEVWRTGTIAWIKAEVFPQVFKNTPVPLTHVAWVEPDVILALQSMQG